MRYAVSASFGIGGGDHGCLAGQCGGEMDGVVAAQSLYESRGVVGFRGSTVR